MEGNAYLVATNEMLPEKNQIGQRQRGTSIPSAASVVNFNNQRSRINDQKFGFSDDLFIDHCSLLFERSADAHGSTRIVTDATGKVVEDMNYGAFGNAIGFDASTALTTYLYSSMPFDAASGNYYDHARYLDTGTGSFTQADYGYSGSLANPMTDLPYAFTGGDPINLLDLNGHDFSLAESLSVESISDIIDTGLGYVNTAFRIYNAVQDISRVIQYAQFAVQVVQAMAGAPTLGAAEEAVGAAITQAFPDLEANSLSAGFTAAYSFLAKDWKQISEAIAAKIPEIAEASALNAAQNLAGWMTAYEEGRSKLVIYGPAAPGPLGRIPYLNIGSELQLALSLGGGRLFGFGVRTSNANANQIFRIDYWEKGTLDVHYQIGSLKQHYQIWP